MQQKKTGVLLGGSGLVGGTIVNYFKTWRADTADIRAPSSKKLSIREEEDIKRYLLEVRPQFVINAAMANLGSDGQLAYEVNYLGAINLARAALSLDIPYIHLSSAATLPTGLNLREEDTIPLTPELANYPKSKVMAEITLDKMAREVGLDYTCIRLGIVYGAHDHKIQGFQRMFFSIADESMPALFTRRNTLHSYSNCRKLPHFIDHILANRSEFSGKTYHFADKEPVDLATLILTLKSYLNLSLPKEIYIPYWLAAGGQKGLGMLLRLLRRIGLQSNLPPELIFFENFYKNQTLNTERLRSSSFVDPFPHESIFTRLPELVVYYLNRWSRENLITTFRDTLDPSLSIDDIFLYDPHKLVDAIHRRGLGKFTSFTGDQD